MCVQTEPSQWSGHGEHWPSDVLFLTATVFSLNKTRLCSVPLILSHVLSTRAFEFFSDVVVYIIESQPETSSAVDAWSGIAEYRGRTAPELTKWETRRDTRLHAGWCCPWPSGPSLRPLALESSTDLAGSVPGEVTRTLLFPIRAGLL